jgi:hypothetical protein
VSEIIIHVVQHDDPLSVAIVAETHSQVAHAEAFTRAGTIIGAFALGGVQERPLNYDGGKFIFEQFIALPCPSEMEAAFEHYLRAVLGEAYDFSGLAEFVEHWDMHGKHHVFCSALMQDALRGCGYFPHPLPIAAHETSPRMLQQMLLCRPDAKIITRDDPIFVAHIASEIPH